MEKLVILSDLWGNLNSGWLVHYTAILNNHFEIEYYDCRELGEIDLREYSEEKIHQLFMNGGVDKAVKNLLKKESGVIHVLGFSIGGLYSLESSSRRFKSEKYYSGFINKIEA